MAAPYHALEFKVANALKALLMANLSAATKAIAPLTTFIDPNTDDLQNRIICRCPDATEDPGLRGNFAATGEVIVKSRFSPPDQIEALLTTHEERVGEVRDILQSTTFAEDLSAIAASNELEVTFQFAHPFRYRTETTERHIWSSTIMNLECCPQ